MTDLWHHVWTTQPDPPHVLVLVTAVLALLAVAPRPAWVLARNAITIAHEGGHALVAVLAGRRLRGIRLHSDTSGLTLTRGRPTGPGMLWLALALLLAVLVMIRNVYGALAVLAVGVVVFAMSWYASPAVQAAFAYAGVWFLLVGGVRPVGELQRLRYRGYAPDSDADQLARLTHVPGLLWVAVFGAVNLAALLAGGYLLVQPVLAQ